MEEKTRKNPWLGLDSYREGEVLYGRDDDIRDLSQCVLSDRDTLFYGKSGIGKSSVLNAGIIPAARRNGYTPLVIRFLHKEGQSYLDQIKTAITDAGICLKEVVPRKGDVEESFYEYFHRYEFYGSEEDLANEANRAKILIIFDQFEEIFTLQTDERKKKQFFAELADFLNDIMPNELQKNVEPEPVKQEVVDMSGGLSLSDLLSDLNLDNEDYVTNYVNDNEVHLVFTIREDFLSEFEYYASSIPSLRQNRYGLRPLNEEQAAQIIMRPIPGLIDKPVAKLIIEKVTGRTDFKLDGTPEIEVDSAVLSLYLNRLYDAKTTDTITRELVESKGHEIISDFYKDAIQGVSAPTVEFLEDMLLNGLGRRDNITVYAALNKGPVTPDELDYLCNKKKILRQFNHSGDLRIEYVHDILCPIVKAHKEERALAKQQEEEKARLLKQQQEELELVEKIAKRNMRRMRTIVATFALLIIVGVAGFVGYYFLYSHEYVSYYRSFERVNGWPVGVGELSKEELSHTPLYYRLSHKGYGAVDTDVKICSSNRMLPLAPRIECLEVCPEDSDKNARTYLSLLSRMESIHFEAGEKGRINKEVVRDEQDSVLFYVNYFHISQGSAWALFTSASGETMKIRDNGLDRVKVVWDTDEESRNEGRVTSVVFYDEAGAFQMGDNGVVGYRMAYSVDGRTTTLYALDEYGRPCNKSYNVTTTSLRGDTIDIRYGKVMGVDTEEVMATTGPNGFWREVQVGAVTYLYMPGETQPGTSCRRETDARGNVTKTKFEGNIPAFQPAVTLFTYNELGYKTSEERLTAGNTPYGKKDPIYRYRWEYDKEGHLVLEERYNARKEKVYSRSVTQNRNTTREETYDVSNLKHRVLVKLVSHGDSSVTTTYWTGGNKPINYDSEVDSLGYHRVKERTHGNEKIISYYVYNEATNKEEPQATRLNGYGGVITYFKKVKVYDADNNLDYYRIYDADGRIVKSMKYYYRDGRKVASAVMGIEGTPVRCPNWEEEGFGYYKLFFARDFAENFVSVNAVNEWNEKSIFYDASVTDENKCYKRTIFVDFKGWNVWRGTEKYTLGLSTIQPVFETDSAVTGVKIPYVHILRSESPLYKDGAALKDGDRIVKLGRWSWGESLSMFKEEWNLLTSAEKRIEVLRPSGMGYERKIFSVKVDKAKMNFAEYHILALTEKELQRIRSKK